MQIFISKLYKNINYNSYIMTDQRIKYLMATPLLGLFIFILFGVSTITTLKPFTISQTMLNQQQSSSTCESCPDYITKFPCSTIGDSVLGGLDFVQYFVDFKLPDGTYNETQVGLQGYDNIYTVYQNFTYHFLNQKNKEIFEENPEKYIPQWGGYCAWGIAGEYCPQYPWNSDCLGPSGNWAHWTINNEKLYFFLFSEAKEKFVNEMDGNTIIDAGDKRWSEWFNNGNIKPMSTACYISSNE
jgi:hypothetical protein